MIESLNEDNNSGSNLAPHTDLVPVQVRRLSMRRGRGRGRSQSSHNHIVENENNNEENFPKKGGRGSRGGRGGRVRNQRESFVKPEAASVMRGVEIHSLASSNENTRKEYCMLCADVVEYWAVGSCNHHICSLCAARVRIRSKDKSCVVCKQRMDVMVVFPCVPSISTNSEQSESHPLTFQSFGIHDCTPHPGFIANEFMGLVFTESCRSQFHYLENIRSLSCPVRHCTCRHSSFTELQSHLQSSHKKQLCEICYDNRPLFIPELPLYTDRDLDKHLKAPPSANVAIGDDKIGGHPPCRFCRKSFFDAHSLLQHMRAQHLTCSLCRSTAPIVRYYSEETVLWEHIQRDHVTCPLCFEGMGRDVRAAQPYSSGHDLTSHMRVQHSYTSTLGRSPRKTLTYLDMDPSQPDPYNIGSRDKRHTNDGHRNSAQSSSASQTSPSTTLIPANMRIAGRVTGTGNFRRDAADDALERHSSEAHARSRRKAASALQSMNDDFPELESSLAVTAITAPVPAHTYSMAARGGGSGGGGRRGIGTASEMEGEVSHEDTSELSSSPVLNEESSRKKESSGKSAPTKNIGERRSRPQTGVTSLSAQLKSMGLGASVQGVGRKHTETSLSEREKMLEREKKERRTKMLADAFGVFGSEEEKREKDEVSGATDRLLHRPLYSSSLLIWGKKQKTILTKVERKLNELLVDGSLTSVSLSPMETADRRCVHLLCRNYKLNSYVYEADRKKYVSVVKAPDSCLPLVLLSEAMTANQYQGYLIPLTTAPLEKRPGQPILVFEPQDGEGGPTDSGIRPVSLTVGFLLHQLRDMGITCGAVVLADAETTETVRARSQSEVIARIVGFGAVTLEFPSFLSAFKASEAVTTHTQQSSSKNKIITTPITFPFRCVLAFSITDLETEASLVKGLMEAVQGSPPGFSPNELDAEYLKKGDVSMYSQPQTGVSYNDKGYQNQNLHQPGQTLATVDMQDWPDLESEIVVSKTLLTDDSKSAEERIQKTAQTNKKGIDESNNSFIALHDDSGDSDH